MDIVQGSLVTSGGQDFLVLFFSPGGERASTIFAHLLDEAKIKQRKKPSGGGERMDSIREFYDRYLRYFLAKDTGTATIYDKYLALTYSVRSVMMDKWIETQKRYHEQNVRRVYFLSMEYVLGKNLRPNLLSLGIEESIEEAARYLGVSLDEVMESEDSFDLGNGGKGRIAACFQESMATLGIPAIGYGLRYDYAAYRQEIRNGQQIEKPYDWLHKGHPWEIIRPEYSCDIGFGGTSEPVDWNPIARSWKPSDKVVAVPYDVPIAGYRNDTVNTLRLWSARASEEFAPEYLHHNDYVRACEEKSNSGMLTKVLFPEETVLRATEMRLKQQYFFVSASLQDIMRRYKADNATIDDFDKKVVIHINGSRCSLAIAELMRILVDVERVPWERAWQITQNVFAYTSYAVTRDDMETWPVYMIAQLFPRHMETIFDINQRHLDDVRTNHKDMDSVVPELSLVEEGEVKRFRMGHLAAVGASRVNGVSRAHSEVLRGRFFKDLAALNPKKFGSVTAGVAHRRWLLCANPALADLITDAIGEGWIRDAGDLSQLEPMVDDAAFLGVLSQVKQSAKESFSRAVKLHCGIAIDPESVFDVQSKKIHPYKRQLLHVLNILSRYQRIKAGETLGQRRTHIFAGKANPSDRLAKQIVHLVNVIADLVNGDAQVSPHMKVVFIPEYGTAWAERLVPAADLSEQIATPTLEASGTSNMKFAFNGAITIASQSGSNLEMLEHVGAENMIMFGRQGSDLPARTEYKPWQLINQTPKLAAVVDLLEKHVRSLPNGSALFPLLATIRDSDEYYVLIDFQDYLDKQERADKLYSDKNAWARACLLNIARIGWFSSDRAIREYATTMWKVGR